MNSQVNFEEQLEVILAREIPDFVSLKSCKRLSGGASQETYRLRFVAKSEELDLCMRRAPGGQALSNLEKGPGLATEAKLFNVAYAHDIPAPQIYYVLQEDDQLGDGFIMQWLEGEALGNRIVKAPEFKETRTRLAYQCGQILAKIHAIDIEASDLQSCLLRYTPEQFVQQTWSRYKTLNSPQPMIDYTARWLLDNLPENPRMTLVHNDFRNGNLLVNESGVNAVLDWELSHIGDPMRDLGWLCTNSWRFGMTDKPVGGFGDYDELFKGYEEVSGLSVDPEHVKFWEVFGSFWWAMGSLEMAVAGREGPEKSVERPAIGRRSSESQVDCVNLLIPGEVALLMGQPFNEPDEIAKTDELVSEVEEFLRNDVLELADGRSRFLARVAANNLQTVLRELESGSIARQQEKQRLSALLMSDDADSDSLNALRWQLVKGLRESTITLDRQGLSEHLRYTVVNQVAIDQPTYSGFKSAIEPAVVGKHKPYC